MRTTWFRGIAACVVTVALTSPTWADDWPMRSFDRFAFDSETTPGLWAEVQVSAAHEGDDLFGVQQDIDAITVAPLIAGGGDNWEVGVLVPYQHYEGRVCSFFCVDVEEDGIGDVQTYGKYLFRSEYVRAGAGVYMSLPTGDEDKGLGAGELGIAPFGNAALVLNPVELRIHIGNLFFTDSQETFGGDEIPADRLLWGGGFFWRVNDFVALRAEFVGTHIDRSEFESPILFEPGVDLRIPIDTVDIMIRPTGAIGLTDSAPDWGVGGAISVVVGL